MKPLSDYRIRRRTEYIECLGGSGTAMEYFMPQKRHRLFGLSFWMNLHPLHGYNNFEAANRHVLEHAKGCDDVEWYLPPVAPESK